MPSDDDLGHSLHDTSREHAWAIDAQILAFILRGYSMRQLRVERRDHVTGREVVYETVVYAVGEPMNAVQKGGEG